MILLEDTWRSLEADHQPGVTSRRLYPKCPHDLFLKITSPGARRAFSLHTTHRTESAVLDRVRELPTTLGVGLEFAPGPGGVRDLRVSLRSSELREVFNPLVSDIATKAQAAPNGVEAALAVVDRFEHWRQLLLSVKDSGLGSEDRRGLFGELTVLGDHLMTGLPHSTAVTAWTGPTGAHQDFQLPAVAIEVKSTKTKQPQTIEIASERELDPQGTGSLVLAIIMVDERQGGTGTSLNAAVSAIRGRLVGTTGATFDDLLLRVGYLPHQRELYDEPRYTVRRISFYRVTGEFPRITESDLRPGVGNCHYRISTSGLGTYLIEPEEVLELAGGGL